MTSTNYLDYELYLSALDQARLSADGRECAGRPALDKALERRLLATANPTDYGTLLFDALFPASDDLLAGYREALVIAEESARRLRLRLHIATTAPPRLHRLQWELLYDPKRRLALGRSRDVALSRYLSVSATRPPAVDRPRLLVVVASPRDLTDYQLAELDEVRLRASLRHALSPLPKSVSWEFLEPPATLSRIRDRMVAGGFHALHLQAHGLRRSDRAVAHLVLEDDQRQATFVDEELFAEIFEGQRELRLMTLVACHGGTLAATDPFSGLGPTLVRQGIAAVITMQRAISVDAACRFSEHFYSDLARNGHIDAAAAEARLHLHLVDPQGVEWGTPALFMRLPQGYLWQPADTTEDRDQCLPTAEIQLRDGTSGDDSIDTQELVHSATDSFPVPAAVAERRTAGRRRRTVRGTGALALMLLGVLVAVFGRGLLTSDLGLEGTPRIAVLGLRELPTAAPEPWIVTAAEELLAHDLNASPGIEIIPTPDSTADDPETVQRLGEETGANAVLSGHVAIGTDGDVRIVVRMRSTETGKVVDRSAAGDTSDLLEITASLAAKVLYTLGVEATASPGSGPRPKPVSPQARQLYAHAQAALRVLDAPAADKALDEAIRLAPENPKLRAARAEAQALLGNAGEAERQAQLALAQAWEWGREERLLFRVLLLETRREWARAAAASRALSASDARPQDAELEDDLRLARLLIRGGQQRQIEEAIEILQRLEGPAIDDLRILLLQADAARVQSEWDRQLELTGRVIDRAGERGLPLILAKARELRAVALRWQGRLDEARAEAEAARELYDTYQHRGGEAEAWNTLGSIFLDQRNLAAAKSSFEKASSLFKELGQRSMAATILNNLSLSLVSLGEPPPSPLMDTNFTPATGNNLSHAVKYNSGTQPPGTGIPHYLMVWQDEDGIYQRLADPENPQPCPDPDTDPPMCPLIADGGAQPDVAYDASGDGTFLVVWVQKDSGNPNCRIGHICGRALHSDGSPRNEAFLISGKPLGNEFQHPAVAVDKSFSEMPGDPPGPCETTSAEGDFLVVWESTAVEEGELSGILGRCVRAGVADSASEFLIEGLPLGNERWFAPRMAPNKVDPNDGTLVVWQKEIRDEAQNKTYEIGGQRFVQGMPLGNEVQITVADSQLKQRPDVAYDPTSDSYLVVWENYDGADRDLRGRRVRESSTLGNEFQVHAGFSAPAKPRVASLDGEFIVAWQDVPDGTPGDPPESDIYGQFVDTEDNLLGEEFQVSKFADDKDDLQPALDATMDARRYVVTWRRAEATDLEIVVTDSPDPVTDGGI